MIEEGLARLAARVERGRRGARRRRAAPARSVFSARRRRRERVAVDRLDRGHAFDQQVDARAARLALVPLVDAPAHALRVAIRVAEPLHLGVERRELFACAARSTGRRGLARPRRRAPARSRARSRRSRRRARAPTRTRRAARRAVRRARGPARAGRPRARASAAASAARCRRVRARPARRRRRSGSKSMRWQRDRIVGSRSSGAPVTSTTTVRVGRLLERLQHRVGRLVLVAAQPLGLEQHQHLALAFDRRARRFGQDALAHVLLDAVRRAARLELDDVGVHAAQHEPAAPLVVGHADQHRRELARRVLDARAARPDEQVRVPGPCRGVPQRVERALLADDDRVHGARAYGSDGARPRPSTRAATSSGVPLASTTHPAPAGRELAVRGADPGVELGARPLEPIALGARRAPRRRRRERRARRRGRARRPPPPTRSTARPRRRRARAPTPWYASVDGVKRSLTTTAPRASAGRDDLGDVLGAIGEHQQQLGARDRAASSACSNTARSSAPDLRVAGLERDDDLAARRAQRLRRAARPACDLPLPSPPSSTMKRHGRGHALDASARCALRIRRARREAGERS